MIPGEGKCQGLEDETQEHLVLPVFIFLKMHFSWNSHARSYKG